MHQDSEMCRAPNDDPSSARKSSVIRRHSLPTASAIPSFQSRQITVVVIVIEQHDDDVVWSTGHMHINE